MAAWNTGTNLYYLLFSGMASFLLVSWFAAKKNLKGLETQRTAPDAVHRGDVVSVNALIENPRRLPRLSLRVESQDGAGAVFVPTLPGRRLAYLSLPCRFERRGVFPLPEMHLVTAFPFGLIEARQRIADENEIVVYPRVNAARTSKIERRPRGGPAPRVTASANDEFHSLREYIPGDDLRLIAWRASARLGELMVKEYEPTEFNSILFVLDSRYNPAVDGFAERFEEAVELTASLAVTLLNRRQRVALLTTDLHIPEGEGKAQSLKILDALARVTPAVADAPSAFERSSVADDTRGVIYLFITPDPEQWGMRAADGIRVLDPREVVYA